MKEIILRIDDVGGNEYREIIPLMIGDLIERDFIGNLGIIPKKLEECSYIPSIKEAIKKNFEIAMHGFDHNGEEFNSEERSLLREKTIKGIKILDSFLGISKPLTFIPPRNVSSIVAEELLKENNFKIISSRKEVKNILERLDFTSRTAPPKSNDLTNTAEIIKEVETTQGIPVIMIHPFEYMDNVNGNKIRNQEKYSFFTELLDKLKEKEYRTISFQEAIR